MSPGESIASVVDKSGQNGVVGAGPLELDRLLGWAYCFRPDQTVLPDWTG